MEFYHRSELVSETLDIRSLNKTPLSVAIEIITKGKLLFCRDEVVHADYLEKVANSYRQLQGLIREAYA